MAIAVRPTWGDLATGSGDGSGHAIGISRPPKGLLPDGGILAPAPAPVPERALARDALRLVRLLRLDSAAPMPPAVRRLSPDVESVRRQLGPIRSRRSLAASYRREAFHEASVSSPDAWSAADAARTAYAMKWLELGPDRT